MTNMITGKAVQGPMTDSSLHKPGPPAAQPRVPCGVQLALGLPPWALGSAAASSPRKVNPSGAMSSPRHSSPLESPIGTPRTTFQLHRVRQLSGLACTASPVAPSPTATVTPVRTAALAALLVGTGRGMPARAAHSFTWKAPGAGGIHVGAQPAGKQPDCSARLAATALQTVDSGLPVPCRMDLQEQLLARVKLGRARPAPARPAQPCCLV
jgi:hypothetical protein